MKRLLLAPAVILSMITAPVFSQSEIAFVNQSEGIISLKCTVDDYHVQHIGDFTVIHLDEGNEILKAGAPAVEHLTSAIIVDDSKAMSLEVTASEYEEFTNIFMLPSKGNLNRTIDPATVPYQEGSTYQQNQFYPGNLATLTDPYVQGHFRAQGVHFNPVQYNPVTHTLRVYSNIEINVRPTDADGANMLPTNIPSAINATWREAYTDRFINYQSNADRYDQIDEMGNILVITQAQYIEELEPWVAWKKEKGFPTEVVDVATIGNLNAINNYVANYYNTNGLTYLVVVGDEDQVPVELLNNSGGQGYCDACYGYISGNDSYSEIFVGRFLVHTDDELTPFINKVLEYERTPNTDTDWFSVAMGIGSNEGDGIGDDGQADWQHQNGLKEQLLDYTYTAVHERYDGSHSGASPSGGTTADATGSPAASTLSAVINSGCSLINYTGHGAHDLIVTGSYTGTNINALNNNGKYPYFIIVGCCTGDYDDDDASGDTFGEKWIKSPNADVLTGGIGGAFSSVYQSWAPPMEGQDEMNAIITENAGINTRHTLGSIHYHGCAGMNDVYGSQGDEMTDTWILMADPTMQLRTAMPTNLVASHPASLFIGTTNLIVSCNVNDAMVGLTINGEIIATGFISGGQVSLNFPALSGVDPILVTVTSFNTIPYQAYVQVTPADGPYVSGIVDGIDDSAGNNNGEPDYNENIDLNVSAMNSGIDPAMNVVGTISSNNASIVFDVATHSYGTVSAGTTVSGDGAFTYHVDGFIEDQTVVTFTITFTDFTGNTWTTTVNQTINAPAFTCAGALDIDDSTGNNNGRMDGGETVTISIPVTNSGHAATAVDVLAWLTEMNGIVTITGSPDNLGMIAAGATVNATFTVEVDAATTSATNVSFDFSTTSDYYSSNCNYEKTINQNIEDWETGTDQSYPWSYAGNADWFVTTSTVYEGTYSMQSGNINNNQSSTLQVTMEFTESGPVTFMYKTSSELDWDFLQFYIDNTMMEAWSGEVDWTEASYNVPSGTHTLKWVYQKDDIYSDGDDAAWVDNIVMPSYVISSVVENSSLQFSAYPNPVDAVLNVALSEESVGRVDVEVFDALGNLLINTQPLGSRFFQLDVSAFPAGVYYLNVKSNTGNNTSKFVVK